MGKVYNSFSPSSGGGGLIPDYDNVTTIISKTTNIESMSYTPPSNGYIMCSIYGYSGTRVGVIINDKAGHHLASNESESPSNCWASVCVPVVKGLNIELRHEVYSGSSTGVLFVPAK